MDVEEAVRLLAEENPGVPVERIRAHVMQHLQTEGTASDREYPASFRSTLEGGEADAPQGCPSQASLSVRCHCGQCAFGAEARGGEERPPAAIRCHCPGCRRFHASAFGAFVAAEVEWRALDHAGKTTRHRDSCAALGAVDRVQCARCLSKLATRPLEGVRAGETLLALGAVEDGSVPEPLALRWQGLFEEWEAGSRAAWWSAAPALRDGRPRVLKARGVCSCGGCAFTAAVFPGEVQHCYCKLCRRLSGGASMSWIPSGSEDQGFWWTKRETLRLVRTTRHGQRHMCTRCGVCLTIVYDAQPDCMWPVAGVLEDDSLPDADASWYRVIHICCSDMQPWYRLPRDGLPRLKYAG